MHYAEILEWHVWVLHSVGTRPSGCWSKSPNSSTAWIKPPRCCQNWTQLSCLHTAATGDHWSESVSGGGTCWRVLAVWFNINWHDASHHHLHPLTHCSVWLQQLLLHNELIKGNIHCLTSYTRWLTLLILLIHILLLFLLQSSMSHCSVDATGAWQISAI